MRIRHTLVPDPLKDDRNLSDAYRKGYCTLYRIVSLREVNIRFGPGYGLPSLTDLICSEQWAWDYSSLAKLLFLHGFLERCSFEQRNF